MQQYYLSIGGPCLKNTPKSKISPSDVSRQLGQAKNLLTLKQIADTISAGYSFCPATFRDGVRNNDNVEQMQLFALDFDGDKKNGTGCVLPYEEALKRAERCHLPVVMSYETKSSVNWSSYRLIFLYNSPIYEVRLMKLINYLLYYIFPESDKKCKDLARMFYPGKEIIIHNEEYFYLDELLISAQIMADLKGKNTWKTYLNNIQKETQIITIKNSILIGFSSLENQEFSPIPIYINMDLDQNPNNLDKISIYRLDKGLFNAPCYCGDRKIGYIFFSDKKDNPVSLDPPKIKNSELYLKHTNQKIQSERCRLYSEFISGERKLGHEEWFGLCTNMVYLNNGQTEFMNTIRGFPDLYNDPERKYHQMKYIVNNGYYPARCDSYCPYHYSCIHRETAIQTMKKNLAEYIKTSDGVCNISLNELRSRLYSEIEYAICTNIGDTVIKTQTGSGKTTAALEVIKKYRKKVIMAFPNGVLMQEAYLRAIQMGINVTIAPTTEEILCSLSDKELQHINRLYKLGTDDMVSEYLRTLAPYNPTVRRYLNQIDQAFSADCTVFMTHARLMTMGEESLLDATIIIDEDILLTMMPIKRSDVNSLRNFANHCDNIQYIDKIRSILDQCGRKSCYIQSEALCINRHESRYIADMFCDDNAEGCIAGVLRADTYYYDAIENTLNFLVINKLPDTYKRCIMLSATADKYIHSILFPQCRFIDLPEAMYCGKVIQDHSQSFSRNFFDKDPARILKRISDSHPDCNYITFKKFISFIDVPNERKLYFGKALGINSFSGQDLVVIGTPHCPEFVYHLVAQALGKNVSGDSLAQRTIIRNGYEFHMMTFRDKFMQRIQTYFIESELEQAVGRARLLSNDCTVYVYSRYPVKQCILAEDLRQPE